MNTNSVCLSQVIPTETYVGLSVPSLAELGQRIIENPTFIKNQKIRIYVDDNYDKMQGSVAAVTEWAQGMLPNPSFHVILRSESPNRVEHHATRYKIVDTLSNNFQYEKIDRNALTIFIALESSLEKESIPNIKNLHLFDRYDGFAWIERMTAVTTIHFEDAIWSTTATSVGIPVPLECALDSFVHDNPKGVGRYVERRYRTEKEANNWEWYKFVAGISKCEVIEKVVLNSLGMFK